MLTNNQKYQALKGHIQADFPELFWREIRAASENAITSIDYKGIAPNGIIVLYTDKAHMPFYAIAHEIGHWLSYQQGYHTKQLQNAKSLHDKGAGVIYPEVDHMVFQEEERATNLGREYAAKYGLIFDEENIADMNRSLNSYR